MKTASSETKLRLIWGIALSVVIVITGIALAVSCVAIYKSGPSPFSREGVGQALLRLLPLLILCVLGVIGGGVLALVHPSREGKLRGGMPPSKMLERFYKGYSIEENETLQAAWRARTKWKRVAWCYAAAVGLLSALPFLLHLTNASHFTTEHLNRDILFACLTALPFVCFLVGICGLLLPYVSELRDKQLLSEIKAAVAAGTLPKRDAEAVETPKSRTRLWGIRIAVLAVAVLFIVLGIWNGGMRDVLEKGIRICTECIGLG